MSTVENGIEKLRIFVGLSEVAKKDRYTATIVDVARAVGSNHIIKIVVGAKAVRHNISYDEMRAFLGLVSTKAKVPADYVVSNVHGFSQEAIYFGYNSKNDHHLVSQYISVYNKIHRVAGTLQSIEDTNGFYLHETEGGSWKYVIDIGNIEAPTLSVMIALDLAIKNKVSALLAALED